MRPFLVILCVAISVLAGCADDGPKEVEDATSLDDELVATRDTGVIRGIVVDATITPVVGATVSLSGQEASTTTNENGEFGFSDLEPGTYFLTVGKLGWAEVQQSVDVQAGVERPPLVKVQLVQVPGQQPYNQGYVFEGFLACSVRAVARGMACDAVGLGVLGDTILVDYPLDEVPEWVVSELTWESTQQLGGELSFNIRRTDTNTDTVDVEGKSPLSLTLNETVSAQAEFGAGMDMRIIIFTAHLQETEPPAGGLWGVGLQLDQEYTVYTHVFYNYVPSEDWRFLDDPSVPQPPA